MAAAKQPGIGRLVDDSMAAVERDNCMLKDVLPKDYARQSLDQTRLGQLIEANLRSLGFPPPEDGPTGMIDYGKFRLSPERLREQYANYHQARPGVARSHAGGRRGVGRPPLRDVLRLDLPR